jgi:hypothetical protein
LTYPIKKHRVIEVQNCDRGKETIMTNSILSVAEEAPPKPSKPPPPPPPPEPDPLKKGG